MIETASLIFFIGILVLAAIIDFRYGIIPNKIVYPAILVTLLFTLISPSASIKMSLVGGASLAGLLLIPAVLFKSMGMGDIKLAFLIGLMAGFPLGIVAIFSGIIMGGLVAIALITLRVKGRKDEMPYGPYLAMGTILTLLLNHYSLFPVLVPG
jgi:leader peptidase (prepilin peptidase)/N-methyltransferase